jgi:hypothetical protein
MFRRQQRIIRRQQRIIHRQQRIHRLPIPAATAAEVQEAAEFASLVMGKAGIESL